VAGRVVAGAGRRGHRLQPAAADFAGVFRQLGLERRLRHVPGDVRDPAALAGIVRETMPAYVFHLAAQPIVRTSYAQPMETYATNVMGTVHLLEAVGRPAAPVRCRGDQRQVLREPRARAGLSRRGSARRARSLQLKQGCAERSSAPSGRLLLFGPASPVKLASARAGNVVAGRLGGGPHCPRASGRWQRGEPSPWRNRSAARPWQHVLEPLSGYSGWRLPGPPELAPGGSRPPAAAYRNFGPPAGLDPPVEALVRRSSGAGPGDLEDSQRLAGGA